MHLVTLQSADGRVAQLSVSHHTARQRQLLASLGFAEPPQILDVELTAPSA